ncbi:MAG: glycosyltransferase family 87 protein [Acidobacteriota bacterium]|nr:glycosyltransferase family 87 protein [Acidobacteriota bacterium]
MKKTTIVLLAAGLVLFMALFFVRGQTAMRDFEVNYTAGKRLRLAETLYREADGHYQFKYPPFSALLYLPLSFLPLASAKIIWFLVVLAASFAVFRLSYGLVRPGPDMALLTGILPPLILARFFLRELELGQINAVITCLLLLMAGGWMRAPADQARQCAHAAKTGALWAAASALKPYAFIFFPYFLIKKSRRVLACGFACLAAAFLLPSLYYGFPGNFVVHEEWIASLSKSTPALYATQDNISFFALAAKWTGDTRLAPFLAGGLILLAAAGFLHLIAMGKGIVRAEVLECAALLTLIPLVSPLGWDYTLLSSVPAVMIVVNRFPRLPAAWKTALIADGLVIALSYYDLMGRARYARFMSLSVVTVNFMIILGALAYLRVKKMD